MGIGPVGAVPLDIVVEGEGMSFSLAEDQQPGSNPCHMTGRADFPALRPSSDDLFFMASPSSEGLDGQDRLDSDWGLYSATPEGRADLLIGPIRNARGLTWSGDAGWLAFGGDIAGLGMGVWAFDPDTTVLTRVSNIAVDWLTWAPVGREIAAITNDGDEGFPPRRELIIFDASALN
jgi:hypothetical protein